MYINSDKFGLLTVGERDTRITKVGFFLRKYKIDELPQFYNVFMGDMSIIGPRPEVRKYVDQYSPSQMEILNVKPGISDYASIEYANENEILNSVIDPEKYYIEHVLPHKLELNKKYLENPSLWHDIKLIFKTLGVILGKK
jgi:lipopolysaccharide/colanic/teichoic acid biosynthesis glycosyltransferase